MNNIEQFLELVKANPNLPIIPMVDYEVVGDDSYGRWYGSFGKAKVEEYVTYQMYGDGEQVVYKDDVDDLFEYIYDHYNITEPDMTDEEIEKEILKKIDDMNWRKAIFVNIDLPEVN